jgi:protein O-mannosyl-transferase
LQQSQVEEGIAACERAIELKPNTPSAHSNLGSALAQKGRWKEALAHACAAVQLEPGNPVYCNNAAWQLATCPVPSLRNGAQAVEFGLIADRLTGGTSPLILGTLAAAYAQAGRFPEAVATARRGLALTTNPAIAERLRAHLKLYEAGQPYISPTPDGSP